MSAKHFIMTLNSWTLKRYNREYKRAQAKYSNQKFQKENRGSHNYLINLLSNVILNTNDDEKLEKSLEIIEKLSDLKKQRVDADYTNVSITPDMATESRYSAKEIITFIRKQPR